MSRYLHWSRRTGAGVCAHLGYTRALASIAQNGTLHTVTIRTLLEVLPHPRSPFRVPGCVGVAVRDRADGGSHVDLGPLLRRRFGETGQRGSLALPRRAGALREGHTEALIAELVGTR